MRNAWKVGKGWILAAGLCLGAAWGAGTVAYQHKAEGFSLAYPAGWDVQEDYEFQGYKIPFLALRPAKAGDTFRENINVMVETLSLGLSPQGYLDANLDSMKKMLQQFKVKEQGKIKGGAAPGTFMVYTHVSSGVKVQVLVGFFTQGRRGFSVTCSATPGTFEAYRPTFLRILRSFKP